MRVVLFLALLLSFLPVASAEPAACEPVQLAAVGMACLRPDGFYDVVLADGTRLTTHGPDPLPPPGGLGFEGSDEQREPVCATDTYLHVLYGHPRGRPSRIDQADRFREAVRRMNALLNADAMESGSVTADYKVLCDGEGRIQVDAFVGPAPGDSDFDPVVSAARGAGFSRAGTDFLIFYDDDAAGVCGVGSLTLDDSLSASNANLAGPDYGVVYASCWFDRTPMHENGHNRGAVQLLAPDTDLSGHCLEGIDVMCYPTSMFLVLCGDRIHFDCDHDTYFDAATEPGEWLASHWNLGSRLNTYIAFDHKPAPPEPEAGPEPAPEATEEKPPQPTNRTATPTSQPPRSNTTTAPRTVADLSTSTPTPQGPVVQAQQAAGPALAAALAALACAARLRRRPRS